MLILAIAQLACAADPVPRAPYLQRVTPDEATICWMTRDDTAGRVRFGLDPEDLDRATEDEPGQRHEVRLTGLSPDTTWYYAVEVDGVQLTEGADELTTAPAPGSRAPIRAWVLGDSGTVSDDQREVLWAWYRFNGGLGAFDPLDPADLAAIRPDLFLHTGDIAYNSATEDELTAAVFDIYGPLLAGAPLWPTYGNHDGYDSSSEAQTGPWFEAFAPPSAGEGGGVASGREDWYSFDWGNVHFIELNAYDADRQPGAPMLDWLEADLALAGADSGIGWIVAYWHHPPYSKGSHDSDIEIELVQMRENVNPILETGGVDLVLNGHSHAYERSHLVDGAYETPTGTQGLLDDGDGDPSRGHAYRKPSGLTAHGGAVYVVAGHGGTPTVLQGQHPLMATSEARFGSVVMDIEGDGLRLSNVRSDGAVDDQVAILKGRALMVATPDGGELLLPGEPCALSWVSSGGFERLLLEYSADDGQTWTAIAETDDTGSYPWIVPELDTDRARIRISDALDPSVSDTSSAPFRVGGEDLMALAGPGSEWRYTDAADKPGADWADGDFDDSSWSVGVEPFGYGDGDEGTALVANLPSYYLRRVVTLDRAVRAARMTARIDDGVVVWINGVRALDWNVDSEDHYAFATGQARANEVLTQSLDPALFQAGSNVIAVQLKQYEQDTEDLALTIELRAVLDDPIAPAEDTGGAKDSAPPDVEPDTSGDDSAPPGDSQPANDGADPAVNEGSPALHPEPRCACGCGPPSAPGLVLLALIGVIRRRSAAR